MTMKEMCKLSPEARKELQEYMILKGNLTASLALSYVEDFYNREVIVVKGRKVPVGTKGRVFWLGSYDNSKYGDPWGIYTIFRAGIKDASGNVFWTNVDNLKVL